MNSPAMQDDEVAAVAGADLDRTQHALESLLRSLAPVRLAVSGGVDSMTLAILAGRTLGAEATMIHAVSPAVPETATDRIHRVSRIEGWTLRTIDAGEFSNESYRSNPYDRCFHCKSDLYRSIAAIGCGTILSGANADDLEDYRPGLRAAKTHDVHHPFVTCGVGKDFIRALCHQLGYPEIARLPASPCLASRVETGTRIEPATLAFVHLVEHDIDRAIGPKIVRCRIRRDSVVVELDAETLVSISTGEEADLVERIAAAARKHGAPTQVRFEPYRRGSAFVQFIS
jgi:pyridinium-3,5-biscarboxylic acid mononucleotide sulfurtransferase